MGRIRTIKPEFFKDEELAELSLAARMLFIGLWTLADREGRLEDRPKRIKADVFPYDDINVDHELGRLHEAGFIVRYEAEGRKYIQVVTFLRHQRPHHKEEPSTIPPPVMLEPSLSQACVNHDDLGSHASANHDNLGFPSYPSESHLAPQEGKGREQEGKGKEGNGASREHGHAPPSVPAVSRDTRALALSDVPVHDPAGFEMFWRACVKRKKRADACQAWDELRPGQDTQARILERLAWGRRDPEWLKNQGEFVPLPATFLRGRRWTDEPPVPPGPSEKTARTVAASVEAARIIQGGA